MTRTVLVHAACLALITSVAAAAPIPRAFSSGVDQPQPEPPAQSENKDKQPQKKDPAPPAPAPAAPAPASPPADAKQPDKKSPATDPNLADPSVEQIIKDMEKPGQARKPVAPGAGPAVQQARPGASAGADASAAPGKLLREGTFLTSRRGRIIRSAAGDWLYTFDADASGQTDPSMVLMPCMNLMGMEKVAERHGEAATFNVSGQVFVYHGRNYLLPTVYQVNRPSADIRSTH